MLSLMMLLGCGGGPTAWCDAVVSCEGDDDGFCQDNVDLDAAVAEDKGCGEAYEGFLDCLVAESACEAGVMRTAEDACDGPYAAWTACVSPR